MPLRVKVQDTLTREKIAALVAPFVSGAARGEHVLLDLSDVSWAPPFSLVTLVSFLDHFHASADGVRLICPKDDGCRQYLAASGFLQQVPKGIGIVRGESLRLTTPSGADTVLAVTRLDREVDVPAVRRRVESRLDEMLGTGDPEWTRTKGAVLDTLGELCENIFLHADYDVGWVGAQRYRNRFQGQPWVVIGIADAGQGIRRSLAPTYPELEELPDGRVIERAVEEELSRLATPDRRRGTGFHVLKKATREYDGSFYLRSGSGAVERKRRRQRLEPTDNLDGWPGTQLEVAITCG